MFGKITLDAFIHGPIETIAQFTVILGVVAVVGLLFYFKRWKWLWKEWITSVDHKKIGIMYLILSAFMLAIGATDA